MAAPLDNRKIGYRIFLGVVVLVLGGSMLLYLVPQTPGTGEAATDTVAKVGDQSVTLGEVRQQLAQIEQRNQVPQRLGITVSDQERADRIKQYVPGAFNNGTFVGMDRYAAEVQARFQLTVPVFEELIRQGLLEEKFRKRVT